MKTGKTLVYAAEAVKSKRCWRSDHFLVFLKPISLCKYRCGSKRDTNGGWKWEGQNSKKLFCNEVMTAMNFDGC